MLYTEDYLATIPYCLSPTPRGQKKFSYGMGPV